MQMEEKTKKKTKVKDEEKLEDPHEYDREKKEKKKSKSNKPQKKDKRSSSFASLLMLPNGHQTLLPISSSSSSSSLNYLPQHNYNTSVVSSESNQIVNLSHFSGPLSQMNFNRNHDLPSSFLSNGSSNQAANVAIAINSEKTAKSKEKNWVNHDFD